ncbi:MAG: phosphoribosylamine--glycine ligase [Patescibacteria group bacterium]
MNKARKALILGSGAREDSIVWRLLRFDPTMEVYAAPGNPGMAMRGCKLIPLSLDHKNFELLKDIALNLGITLVIVGPDNALVDGVVGVFTQAGIPTFGPETACVIEASKNYAKNLMRNIGIPTAPFETFSNYDDAAAYVRKKDGQVVVKADGLALGKGVRVCNSVNEALQALTDFMINEKVGAAGKTVVIEDKLVGTELSIHAFCDGTDAAMLLPVRDHKTLTSDPKSPMTGGMGVWGPIDIDSELMTTIKETIVMPCLQELNKRRTPFRGCLYPGLMLTADGPKVLEFNARLGDPEAQWYMRMLREDVDVYDVFLACAEGNLKRLGYGSEPFQWHNANCSVITLAAAGYPEKPQKGDPIEGLQNYTSPNGKTVVFHGGTAWVNGELVTNGGRVLSVSTVLGNAEPVRNAYEPLRMGLGFSRFHYRGDIGEN